MRNLKLYLNWLKGRNPMKVYTDYQESLLVQTEYMYVYTVLVLLSWNLRFLIKNVNYHEHLMFHKLRTYLRTWQPDIWNCNHEIRTTAAWPWKVKVLIYGFLLYSLYIHYVFIVCSLYRQYMFTVCSLYVHYIFTIYSPYIHCVFTICSHYIPYAPQDSKC